MTPATFLTRFRRDERGLAAEFALVLPLLLLFVLGALDAGLYMWHVNMAEKATQVGARVAIVTNPVAQSLTTTSYVNATVGETTVTLGDRIPAGALGVLICADTGNCQCELEPCPALTRDGAAFTRILNRMQDIYGNIDAENLQIEYRGAGLGFAGDPSGPDIAPLVTVRLINMEYTPLTGLLFGANVGLPDAAYSLTAEDSSGSNWN